MNFLLFGQSNMAGADAVPVEPWEKDPSDERSVLYWHRHIAQQEMPVPPAPLPLTPVEWMGGRIHGPEIGLSRELHRLLPQEQFVLVKVTGQIPVSEPRFLWSGVFLDRMLGFYAAVCSEPPTAILMAQGIDEALSATRCAAYKINLIECIDRLRSHFGFQVPFVIGQSVDSPLAPPEKMRLVRDAQRQVAASLPMIGFCHVNDLPNVNYHHLSSASQLEFGRRFARALCLIISPSSVDPSTRGDIE